MSSEKSKSNGLLNFCVFLSAVSCVMLLLINIPALFNNHWFLSRMTLGIIKSGDTLGFFGNVLLILAMAYCFGGMALEGFFVSHKGERHKQAILYGIATAAVCILSLIFSVASGGFTIGDVVILLFPVLYVISVLITPVRG